MRRYTATLTANNTATISLNENEDAQILLTQGNTGGYVVTWATVNKWFTPTGNPPTLKTAIGGSDLIRLWRTGGVIYGSHAGDVGTAGATGPTGPAGLLWRGAFGSGTAYAIGDAVYSAGSSYVAIAPSTGVTPATDANTWSLLCAGGSGTSGGAAIVDNFTRANGLITAGSPPFTWTKVLTPTASITSNQAEDDDVAGADCAYRAETILTSADHNAQITLGTWTLSGSLTFGVGPCVRFAAAAQTYYLGIIEGGSSPGFRIMKFVAGTPSTLASATQASLGITAAAGGQLKLSVSTVSGNASLNLFYNGASVLTVTDSSSPITGNVRCGFHTYRASSAVHASMSDFRYST